MNRYILSILFISIIFPQRNCLQETQTDALGRSTRPSKDTFAISPSGHFYIHYDVTGSAAPDLQDIDPINGVPDYIDLVGIFADSARHVLVDLMDYDSEPSDGTVGGGEGKYDIYIVPYGSGSYGVCFSEGSGKSYLQISNDYSGYASNFGQTPLEIMQISLSHEYFHAIQYGYQEHHGSGSGSDAYFYEMTSMWIEDIIVPDGNDYLEDTWVGLFLDNPEGTFDNRAPNSCASCVGKGYELALFGHYLSSHVDPLGSVDEKQSTIMEKIWKEYSNQYISSSNYDKPLEVIDRILQTEYQSSFIEAWTDFISRNLYNGIYQDMNNEFYYYIDQKLIDPIKTYYPEPLEDDINIEFSLDNKSVVIKSYELDEGGLLGLDHSSNVYLGRFSIVSTSDNSDLFWAPTDTSGMTINLNSEIHFIYGSENPMDVLIEIEYDAGCGIKTAGSVWPGNTNADGVVNFLDIDQIIRYWNQSTCSRSNMDIDDLYKWEKQAWLGSSCISHADANGDGKVDIADILVIMVNWGKNTSDENGNVYVVADSCSSTEGLSGYYSNFSQIYNSLTGDSSSEIQMRERLEELFGLSPVPNSYQIFQNYPNPFNPLTIIPYYLSKQAEVVLSVFDLMGKEVIKKGAFIMPGGSHEIIINGQNLSSGVYLYQFTIDGKELIPKKMVLLK